MIPGDVYTIYAIEAAKVQNAEIKIKWASAVGWQDLFTIPY